MIVTFSPADGDRQQWEFDPDRVRQSEGEIIEKRFGGTWAEFRGAVQTGNLRARRVLLWHLIRRAHNNLRYEDTPDFYVGELVVEHTREELVALRERIERASLDEDRRREVLDALDMEIGIAPAGGDGAGKVPSNSGD